MKTNTSRKAAMVMALAVMATGCNGRNDNVRDAWVDLGKDIGTLPARVAKESFSERGLENAGRAARHAYEVARPVVKEVAREVGAEVKKEVNEWREDPRGKLQEAGARMRDVTEAARSGASAVKQGIGSLVKAFREGN